MNTIEGKPIHNRIVSIKEELPNSERKIADFILAYPDQVISMTANKLAIASDTSPATVIRFCRSIDIPSFTELKLKISAEISTPNYTTDTDVVPGEAVAETKSKLLANAYRSMKETVDILDDETLMHAVECLHKAPTIYVFGIGASGLVAENLAQKLNRIGKITQCFTDTHLLLSSIASASKNSVFFGISNSGETDEVNYMVQVAKERGLQTIGLSQFGSNALNQSVDISLKTVRGTESTLRSAATSSLMGQFMAIDILFYAYISKNYDEYMEKIANSKKAIANYKGKIKRSK